MPFGIVHRRPTDRVLSSAGSDVEGAADAASKLCLQYEKCDELDVSVDRRLEEAVRKMSTADVQELAAMNVQEEARRILARIDAAKRAELT